ncbi:putative powdery mildew resistance protein, RPW8 [Rosa chinensis]|uniref:Putative powdery mildew resistance protein, RPW8 n=1 Tax=Rosa chinensis TaxID=74649 RepID=A0A2P6SD12_ROSCH|nr:putative powdery mildew resistance protein, RPW8 [Rosa chinensis]
MALEFLAGAPFQLMYDMVKVALRNTKLFRSQLRQLENILKILQPQILEQIRQNNVQLHLSTLHIKELRLKIEDGLMLLEKLGSISNFNVHVWGS